MVREKGDCVLLHFVLIIISIIIPIHQRRYSMIIKQKLKTHVTTHTISIFYLDIFIF